MAGAPYCHGRDGTTLFWKAGVGHDSSMLLDTAECREADVFVKNFDASEPCVSKPIQLPHERPRRILRLDIRENVITISGPPQPRQVLAVALPHQFVQSRGLMHDQVPN